MVNPLSMPHVVSFLFWIKCTFYFKHLSRKLPANTRRWPSVGPLSATSAQRKTALGQCRYNYISYAYIIIPSKLETLTQCWIDVGPPSATMNQHQLNIGWTFLRILVFARLIYSFVFDKNRAFFHLDVGINPSINISIWMKIRGYTVPSDTLQTGRYTLSYPRRRIVTWALRGYLYFALGLYIDGLLPRYV